MSHYTDSKPVEGAEAPSNPVHTPKSRKILRYVVLLLIVISMIVGGRIWRIHMINDVISEANPQPTATQSVEPSPAQSINTDTPQYDQSVDPKALTVWMEKARINAISEGSVAMLSLLYESTATQGYAADLALMKTLPSFAIPGESLDAVSNGTKFTATFYGGGSGEVVNNKPFSSNYQFKWIEGRWVITLHELSPN